jgi:DNA-binding LacI/PurR family transcriptional regulator
LNKIIQISLIIVFITVLFSFSIYAQDSTDSFEQPILITSIGQSSGAMMGKVLAAKSGLSYVYDQRAGIEALDNAKTLIVVLGVSSKGLGAAGVDIEAEIKWASELFDRAGERGIPIIAMHIEGSVRRGSLSNRISELFGSRADYLIVKSAGNEDGLFTNMAEANNIPISTVDATLDVVSILKNIFNIK